MRLQAHYALPKREGRYILLIVIILLKVICCPAQKVLIDPGIRPIEKILSAIRHQTGYTLRYSPSLFQNVPPIDCGFPDSVELGRLLDCIKAGLDCRFTMIEDEKAIFIEPINWNGPIYSPLFGKITNSHKEPLPDATISEKNGPTTSSRADGTFRLPAKGFLTEVTISYAGYRRMRLFLSNKDTQCIGMQPSEGLDQAIVEAYGTTTPRTATGDLSTVGAREIEVQPTTSPLEALEGEVPGLNIQRRSGMFGGAFKVRLGGEHSMLAGNDPLYIVEGMPMATGNFIGSTGWGSALGSYGASMYNWIPNPLIDSVTVMKGAAATAIYGSRAANGVIMITLKKGVPARPAKLRCTVDFYTGFTSALKESRLLNTSEFLDIRKEAAANAGLTPVEAYVPELNWGSRYTDFRKVFTGNKGLVRNGRIDLIGGTSRFFYLLSGTIHQQATEFAPSTTDWQRSLYEYLQTQSADGRFKLGISGIYSSESNTLPIEDPTFYITLAPNATAFDSSGKSMWSSGGLPYVNIPALSNNVYQSAITNLLLHAQASYRFDRYFTLESSLGSYHIGSDEQAKTTLAGQYPRPFARGSASQAVSKYNSSVVEVLGRYRRAIGAGMLEAVLGGSRELQTKDSLIVRVDGYTSDLQLGTGTTPSGTQVSMEKGGQDYRYAALFTRANYMFMDRYILSGSLRRDGSSRFGPGRQFGNFWAVDGAWIFSDETFFPKGSALSSGKLRASAGTTGNDQIGDYQFMEIYNPVGGRGYQGQPGAIPNNTPNSSGNSNTLFNPQLHWETSHSIELGIDLTFWEGLLSFSASAYRSISGDQLLISNLASQTGAPGVLANLPVKVMNEALELVVRMKKIQLGPVRWSSTINLTLPRNKLASFPGLESSAYGAIYVEGKSLSVTKAYHNTGVGVMSGLYTFEDVNHDGHLDYHDFRPTPSLDPRYYGGWANSFSYRNWRLDLFGEVHSQNALNPLVILDQLNAPGEQAPSQLSNGPKEWLDHWRKPGDVSKRQMVLAQRTPAQDSLVQRYLTSDASVIDGSYWRWKTMSLSYQFSEKAVKKMKLQSMQLYIRGQNIFTHTHYPVTDPETQNPKAKPPSGTWVAGFTITF